MMEYKVAEIFSSINGEGTRAGELAVFIRLCGCNLQCSYCDTKWASLPDAPGKVLSAADILEEMRTYGIRNVTLTGGEPLLAPGAADLIELLGSSGFSVEIETNGSVDISPFCHLPHRPIFTMDYKLPGSGMETYMLPQNFSRLQQQDTVKLVAGSREDLERGTAILKKYGLTDVCHVYFSPVFGSIEPAEIVAFMKEKSLNGVRLQLQLHKFIWDPQAKGV